MEAQESALLDAARGGDPEALEALLRHYEQPLYRFSMRMCSNPEDAKDVLQESMLAAARGIEGFRGDAALSSWLYAIARSFCIKRARKPPPPFGAEADTVADSAPAPEEQVANRELLRGLDVAIEALKPEYRELVVLRDIEGLSAAEVADTLELSVSQVKSRLHRARRALREMMAPIIEQQHPQRGIRRPTCPDILEMFSKNLEHEISATVCAQMQDHIDECEFCASTCDSLKETLALCHAVPAPEVPHEIQEAVRRAIRDRSGAGAAP